MPLRSVRPFVHQTLSIHCRLVSLASNPLPPYLPSHTLTRNYLHFMTTYHSPSLPFRSGFDFAFFVVSLHTFVFFGLRYAIETLQILLRSVLILVLGVLTHDHVHHSKPKPRLRH